MTDEASKTAHTPAVFTTAVPSEIRLIATEQLRFDQQNPRFYRLNDASSVDAIVEEMLDDESAQDLMLSIGSKGYFPGEPLLVTPDGNGAFIVVEGNRRLAATKLLNGQLVPPQRRSASIQRLRDAAATAPPTELPCIVYEKRRDVLRYLGYRHITGVKQWDSLSKAKYLLQLRDDFHSDLGREAQLKALAADIGSRPDYVAQLLTALGLYTTAVEWKPTFFGLPVRPDDVEFSYITTAIGYRNLAGWLGLEGRGDFEMKGLKAERLKMAFGWMFSKDQLGRTVVGESRRLELLADIVKSETAIKKLEDNLNLDEAYLYTDGPQAALQKALAQATEKVAVVWQMLGTTKPLNGDHLIAAEALFEGSKDVRNFLKNKIED